MDSFTYRFPLSPQAVHSNTISHKIGTQTGQNTMTVTS